MHENVQKPTHHDKVASSGGIRKGTDFEIPFVAYLKFIILHIKSLSYFNRNKLASQNIRMSRQRSLIRCISEIDPTSITNFHSLNNK